MKANKKSRIPTTHGGGEAVSMSQEQALRRSLLGCFLWEDGFYESGEEIARRIHSLASGLPVEKVCALAVEARNEHHLRHAPLWLLIAALQKGGSVVGDTIAEVIQRADEIPELLAMYWRDGRRPLSAQLKKGLAKAFQKFDSYALAKYDRKNAVRLRDALFLCHAKPKDEEQAALWRSLVEGTLESPDTWEVSLSAGKDKQETFTRLLTEKKLGYLALLRNLRNMAEAQVDHSLVKEAILARKGAEKVFPFQFFLAAKQAPDFRRELEKAMLANIRQQGENFGTLSGKTVIVVDISGSMNVMLSKKSVVTRMDAACAMAAIIREACEDAVVYATAGSDFKRVHQTEKVDDVRGFCLVDSIKRKYDRLGGGGIFLKQVMEYIQEQEQDIHRVVVITDEQDCSGSAEDAPRNAPALGEVRYMVNVATDKNGIGYERWTHIDGFSDNTLRFLLESERLQAE